MGAICIAGPRASANVGNAFGFGSRAAALGGAVVADGGGAFAAYHNPAALAFDGEERLKLDLGLKGMHADFIAIRGVVIENAYTSDKTTPVTGDVDTEYRDVLGEELGVAYRLLPEWHNLSFGVAVFLPVEQAAYVDTGETFEPEYFLYRSRLQRPQVELGLGADLGAGFKVGFGLHLAYSLTSNATVFLQTDSSKPSTMRFATSLKPRLSPQLGARFTPVPELALGAVVRFAVTSPNQLYLKSGARALGGAAALDFNFNSASALFYDPLTVELGFSWQHSPVARFFYQTDYQAWSKFEAPALMILDPKNENCGTSPCGIIISPGKGTSARYRDILIPRVGEEVRVSEAWTARAGYAFRPSILQGPPTGAGNYLDPSKHELAVGAGYRFERFLGANLAGRVDFHLAFQKLVTQDVEKSAGDENGDNPENGSTQIGAPGYQAGGNMFGGGLSLSLAF